MQTYKKNKIIISGGGTGGHIFPAIAIAEALKEKLKNPEILFIGAIGRMEMEKVPALGYEIKGLWISGIQRKITVKNLLFPFRLIASLIKASMIIKKFKPEVVIGTGGYASGPTLKIASGLNIPCLIQEQNSFPGITNRLLSKKVNRICVAYDGMEKYFPSEKITLTGNPVRKELINIKNKSEKAFEFFGINNANPVLLVIGGSQGALAINEAIAGGLEKIKDKGINLIWQTGKLYFNLAKEKVMTLNMSTVHVFEFISGMDLAYSLSDVIISRAGAIAISEICLAGKPVIFVPLPTAAENHQHKNAFSLVKKNAALLVENKNASNELVDLAIDLLENNELKEKLAANINKLAIGNAGERIADEVIKLINYT